MSRPLLLTLSWLGPAEDDVMVVGSVLLVVVTLVLLVLVSILGLVECIDD